MPRLACPEEPRSTLHVVQRGRARLACFSCAGDRAVYLRALRECAEREQCAVHAYALMGNHVHLLFTPARAAGAARLMPAIAACYARHLATAYDHEDSLWEEPYDASPVHARRHLLACMRYIEENPVRAGLAAHPGGYPWSSYRANALGEDRSEEHTSELQSQFHLVCRLLLEKKKKTAQLCSPHAVQLCCPGK